MTSLTCQCRHEMEEHERNGKCTKCPCTVFQLLYGSYSEDARERLEEYFIDSPAEGDEVV
jgi:hypothetical protein